MRLPAAAATSSSSSSTARASKSFIMKVQHLIERCLTFYLDKEECAQALFKHGGIDPIVTRTVWKELEKANPDFFEQYNSERPVIRKLSLASEEPNDNDENSTNITLTRQSLEDISNKLTKRRIPKSTI